MNTRISMCLFALLWLLAGTSGALAAPSNTIADLEVTVHGTAPLELSSCIYPDVRGGALFMAFIDNTSDASAQGYTMTLHGADGALLAERTYTTLQPGDSDVFAVRLDAAQAIVLDGAAQCDDGQ